MSRVRWEGDYSDLKAGETVSFAFSGEVADELGREPLLVLRVIEATAEYAIVERVDVPRPA